MYDIPNISSIKISSFSSILLVNLNKSRAGGELSFARELPSIRDQTTVVGAGTTKAFSRDLWLEADRTRNK
jgi:hypothetical protein